MLFEYRNGVLIICFHLQLKHTEFLKWSLWHHCNLALYLFLLLSLIFITPKVISIVMAVHRENNVNHQNPSSIAVGGHSFIQSTTVLVDPWFGARHIVLAVVKIKLVLKETHKNHCLLLKSQQEDCRNTKPLLWGQPLIVSHRKPVCLNVLRMEDSFLKGKVNKFS